MSKVTAQESLTTLRLQALLLESQEEASYDSEETHHEWLKAVCLFGGETLPYYAQFLPTSYAEELCSTYTYSECFGCWSIEFPLFLAYVDAYLTEWAK